MSQWSDFFSPTPPPPSPSATSFYYLAGLTLVAAAAIAALILQQQRTQSMLRSKDKQIAALKDELSRDTPEVLPTACVPEASIAQAASPSRVYQTKAAGEVKGIDKMNQALWRMGAMKHKPPSFRYFDPDITEKRAVEMKEVKLPRAKETHELCYEPKTRCLFVSQMSNSVLVRIPVGADGMLLDDQDAWNIGPGHPKTGEGVSGLHGLTLSKHNPGCLWLTLQFANTLLLLDAATMGIRQVIKCPTLLTRSDGTVLRIGGPHCLIECGGTGDVWVALKGSVPCHPGVTGSTTASLAAAINRVCCNPQAIKERMEAVRAAEASGNGDGAAAALEVLPEGYAIWRLSPGKYDPKESRAYGGMLFECEPSPPMMAIDRNCNCWVVQDRTPAVMKIDRAACEAEQVPVPLQEDALQMTGPAVMTAPDGAVWATLLGVDGGLIRYGPDGTRSLYSVGNTGQWLQSSRFIHMRFVALHNWWNIFVDDRLGPCRCNWPRCNCMYLISSNLLDDTAMNMITCVMFNPYVGNGWVAPLMRKDIPLPTQDCCCHRIEIIKDSADDLRVSAVVSELASSRLYQTKLFNLELYEFLFETKEVRHTACGKEYVVMHYETIAGANSKAALGGAPGVDKDMFKAINKYLLTWRPVNRSIDLPHHEDPEGLKKCSTPEETLVYKEVIRTFKAMNPHCQCN